MPIRRLQFTEWKPDQPAIGDSLNDAKNVVPVLAGYAPFPSASNLSNAASESLNNVFFGFKNFRSCAKSCQFLFWHKIESC